MHCSRQGKAEGVPLQWRGAGELQFGCKAGRPVHRLLNTGRCAGALGMPTVLAACQGPDRSQHTCRPASSLCLPPPYVMRVLGLRRRAGRARAGYGCCFGCPACALVISTLNCMPPSTCQMGAKWGRATLQHRREAQQWCRRMDSARRAADAATWRTATLPAVSLPRTSGGKMVVVIKGGCVGKG